MIIIKVPFMFRPSSEVRRWRLPNGRMLGPALFFVGISAELQG